MIHFLKTLLKSIAGTLLKSIAGTLLKSIAGTLLKSVVLPSPKAQNQPTNQPMSLCYSYIAYRNAFVFSYTFKMCKLTLSKSGP